MLDFLHDNQFFRLSLDVLLATALALRMWPQLDHLALFNVSGCNINVRFHSVCNRVMHRMISVCNVAVIHLLGNVL